MKPANHDLPPSVRVEASSEAPQAEPKNWLIYDTRSECYWGPNRGGYFKSIASAGLYTQAEAEDAQRFAETYGRHEVARPLEEHREAIERLYSALAQPSKPAASPTVDREASSSVTEKDGL